MVSFEKEKSIKTTKTQLLVIDYKFIYNCIISHPTLVTLMVVSFKIHSNSKYHSKVVVVATTDVSLEACMTYFLASLKLHQDKDDNKGK